MTDDTTASNEAQAQADTEARDRHFTHYNNNTETNRHDIIADRTGELMREAHTISQEMRRATIAGIQEPDTGTPGAVILKPDGRAEALPADFFDDYRDAPKRREGTATLTRIESFIGHVNRFKTEHSAIFAGDDPKRPSLTAVLDYHQSVSSYGIDAVPDFGRHRAHFAFPLAPEWRIWLEQNGKSMSVLEFGHFLEDNFVHVEQVGDFDVLNDDIKHLVSQLGREAVATPSKLLVLSNGLTINENAQVANHQNLATGEAEIRFKTEHTDAAGAPLAIPKLFIVTIPVFARGDLYRIAARLRYRVSQGRVSFSYDLWGVDRVFEQAFVEACSKAQDETGLPLLYGTAE